MGEYVPLPQPDPEPTPSPYDSEEPHDDAYVEDTGYEYEPSSPRFPLPLAVRHALREVLGSEGDRVAEVWVAALDSDSERIRLGAAKELTRVAVALSKQEERVRTNRLPLTAEDVRLLSLPETYAALVALYVSEIEGYRNGGSDEAAIQRFRERHPEQELPLALLRRALS